MSIEDLLRSTIPMLNSMHVLGSEAGIVEGVKHNIRTAIMALEKKKEEAKYANHNEQRENV